MPPIRIVLADDHTLVRAGIRSLLQGFSGIEVVGEAEDGFTALRIAAARRPDVVLLDIGMPGMSGLEVVPRLSKIDSSIRAVMLSIHKAEEYVLEALRAGAVGYLVKDSAVAELEIAVRAVARGETYLSPAISRAVVHEYIGRSSAVMHDTLAALTPRQREVLQLVVMGNTSKEIAQQLGVSYRTVEVHRMHLMRRLNVHDSASLVRLAVGLGLVVRNE
ncbi:MAG TPA: response regulator transcription factor [Thermoanaerobaculia bacterium]|nr:response regulator transcription factor [Thermoanaerobaculia bacterium]